MHELAKDTTVLKSHMLELGCSGFWPCSRSERRQNLLICQSRLGIMSKGKPHIRTTQSHALNSCKPTQKVIKPLQGNKLP